MPRRDFKGEYQSFKSSGVVNAGGTIAFKAAGTANDKNTFSDSSLSATNSNPLTLDSEGKAAIFLESGLYDYTILDSSGSTVETGSSIWDEVATIATNDPNMVFNGSFEDGTGTAADQWSFSAVETIERTTDDRLDGQYSVKFVSTGSGGGSMISDFIPIPHELRTYTVSWGMKSTDAAVRNVVDVFYYDASQTKLTGSASSTNLYDASTGNPTSWSMQSGTHTPPSTAHYCRIDMTGCHSSDVTAGTTYYDSVLMRSETSAPSLLSGAVITTNTTIQASDLAGVDFLIVLVDISGGSVTITLPAASAFQNKIIHITLVTDAGATSTNKMVINNASASEVWTGYHNGDYYRATSDGSTVYKIDGQATVAIRLGKSSMQTYNPSTSAQVTFDSVVFNWGGGADTANNKINAPHTGVYRINANIMGGSIGTGNQTRIYYIQKNGTTDVYDVRSWDDDGPAVGIIVASLSASDSIAAFALNFDGSSTNTVIGTAALDDTFFSLEMIRRT